MKVYELMAHLGKCRASANVRLSLSGTEGVPLVFCGDDGEAVSLGGGTADLLDGDGEPSGLTTESGTDDDDDEQGEA